MPYSKFILFLINLALGLTSGGIYWFRINLWYDQGFFISTLLGTVITGATVLFTGFTMFARHSERTFLGYLAALLLTVFFVGQAAGLLYCLWIKT